CRAETAPITQFLIPVWNDLLSLVLCLPSVLEVADHVLLFDDGSDDGSADYVENLIQSRPDIDIRLIRGDRQEGAIRASPVLFGSADPSLLRVWADADDLVIPTRWPGFLDGLRRAGILHFAFHEVWGDHRHTTHWGLRGDLCHLAQWPGDRSLTGWTKDRAGY